MLPCIGQVLTRVSVVADRILKRSYPSAGSGELRAGSVCLGRTLFSGGGIRMPTCTCGRRRRAMAAGVKRLMNRGYLCRALTREIFRFEIRFEV